MRRLLACCLLSTVAAAVPAQAQLDRFGTSSDVRSADRPIADPPLRAPDAAGLPSDSMKYLGGLGPQSSDEILKSLEKDLGQSVGKSPAYLSGPGYRPSESLGKESPAPTTFK